MVLTVESTVPNTIEDVVLGGASVSADHYDVGGLVVTLKVAYLETLTNEAHTFTIELEHGDDVASVITVVDTA